MISACLQDPVASFLEETGLEETGENRGHTYRFSGRSLDHREKLAESRPSHGRPHRPLLHRHFQ